MKNEEVKRLTKLYLQNELHHKKQKESMSNILNMLFGNNLNNHIGEEEGRRYYNKMVKKKNEILKNWEKYKSFAFIRPTKKKMKKANMGDSIVDGDDDFGA